MYTIIILSCFLARVYMHCISWSVSTQWHYQTACECFEMSKLYSRTENIWVCACTLCHHVHCVSLCIRMWVCAICAFMIIYSSFVDHSFKYSYSTGKQNTSNPTLHCVCFCVCSMHIKNNIIIATNSIRSNPLQRQTLAICYIMDDCECLDCISRRSTPPPP